MVKLCIAAVVSSEQYSYYIPLCVYSILKHYPEYRPVICYQGKLNDKVKESLSLLQPLGSFIIKEGEFEQYSTDRATVKALRWLLYLDEFEQYDYVYIGDVDIFIIRETPSLLEQHIAHCKTLNLPYSNMIRKNSNRLTGLHFVQTKPYFDAIRLQGEQYRDCSKFNQKDPLSQKSVNEYFLYRLVEQSGLGLPPRTEGDCLMSPDDSNKVNFRPHHGLHLRVFGKVRPELRKNEAYQRYYAGFKKCQDDPIYQQILSYTSKEIKQQIQYVERTFK